jgi:hypothetical protein
MSAERQFLLYTAPDGAVKVDVFLKDETARPVLAASWDRARLWSRRSMPW